ncbi:MAG: UbiA family prenyltransferase [bacterium]
MTGRHSRSRWDTVSGLLQAARPHNGFACALLAMVGYWHGGKEPLGTVACGLGAGVFLLTLAAHLVNDIRDFPADRINRPGRPLPSGRLAPGAARHGAVCCLVGGLGLGLLVLPAWWPWWLFWAVMGIGYSAVAKGRGWWAPLWAALVIASVYLPGAAADGLRLHDVSIILAVAYFIFFREFIKNLEDAVGDRQVGYQSLAGGRCDNQRALLLLAAPLLTGGGLLVVSQPVGSWGQISAAAFLACVLAALWCLPTSRWRRRHLAGSLLKGGAFCGLGLLVGFTG